MVLGYFSTCLYSGIWDQCPDAIHTCVKFVEMAGKEADAGAEFEVVGEAVLVMSPVVAYVEGVVVIVNPTQVALGPEATS